MAKIDRLFLMVAAIAALLGMFLGGGIQDGAYEYLPVHVHLLLFGWVSNAIYGLFYAAYPTVAATRVAKAHFLAAAAGAIFLPLGFVPFDGEMILGILWTGATFAMLAAALFIWSVFKSFGQK